MHFRMQPNIGPLLKIFSLMLKQFAIFSVFFLFFLLLSSEFAIQAYPELDGVFDHLSDTLLYLFNAALSNYDFEDIKVYENLQGIMVGTEDQAKIFLLLFIIGTFIMMLNLLIAIIVNVYDTLKESSIGLYLNEIVEERPMNVFDVNYSGMLSAPFPLNLVQIPFFPVYLMIKSEKFNDIVLRVSYVPIAVSCTAIFSVVSVVLLPLAFLKALGSKILLSRRKLQNQESKKGSAKSIALFLVFGPLILTLNTLVDIKYFVQTLWKKEQDLDLRREKPKSWNLTTEEVKDLLIE